MKKIIIIIIILIIVGIGIYYIVFNNSYNKTPAPNGPVSNIPQTPAISDVTVNIKNFSFNPSILTVKTGTKVTWVNNDTTSHTVTSDSGNLLNSSPISSGQSFGFIFTDPISVNYHCSIHPTMRGEIIVEK